MFFHLLAPSLDAQHTGTVTSSAKTLAQLGYVKQDNNTGIVIVQNTGAANIKFTRNINSSPGAVLGFTMTPGTFVTFNMDEVAVALFYCATSSTMEIAGARPPRFPQNP